ncbi:MAG: hypothetical protein RMK29_19870 [Myxococcales bacterium]|nr:hypothetical protein [Myxococcota bacterium]MDW8283967.1 hypothetical protein [Myxococcales bacterium]
MPGPAQTVYGRPQTDAQGIAQGPFAHVTTNRAGGSAGVGLLNGPLDPSGRVTGNVLSVTGGLGRWYGPDGQANYGLAGDATLVRVGMAPGGPLGPLGFDVGVLSAQAGAQANSSTASLGAQANIIDGSVSLGNDRHMVRAGLSLGVGLAGRVHYGDTDRDGVPEYGLGADFGPFSFDVKSEWLGHAARGIRRGWDRVASW